MRTCRICKSKNLQEFFSLGKQPLANGFISRENLSRKEKVYSLTLCVCTDCWLVQLKEIIPAKLMFKNYLYIPSTSKTRMDHFYELANVLTTRLNTSSKDLAVDIGSNDGSLLECFMQTGIRILGVDPSVNLAKVAELKGIRTINALFSKKIAKHIIRKYGPAKVITTTNTFGHVNNLHEFVAGIEILLAHDGYFVIEVPYLLDLLENCEFDTIYHEHLSYFSVRSLLRLFKLFDLEIFSIQHMDLDGGSLRVFVRKKGGHRDTSVNVQKFIDHELSYKMDTFEPYERFANDVLERKKKFKRILQDLKKKNKRIVGHGAPAKGNTFLNYCGVSQKDIDYVVDSTPYKQGLYLPGSHIPIYHENKLFSDHPDYIIILAWNFADEIIKKNSALRRQGVRFILPNKNFEIL